MAEMSTRISLYGGGAAVDAAERISLAGDVGLELGEFGSMSLGSNKGRNRVQLIKLPEMRMEITRAMKVIWL